MTPRLPVQPLPQLGIRRSQLGFTLIELVAVVVIIAVVTAAVAAGVQNVRGASVQAEAGKLAAAVRYLYNLAVVSGRNQRLVIDMDSQSWWAEEQASSDPCEAFLLPGEEGDEAEEGKEGPDGQRAAKGGFEATKSQLLQKTSLEKGITFLGAMTSHDNQPLEKGQAYVYFFPNGTTEQALIQLQGREDDVMTVEVMALQGAARIHGDKVELDTLAREKE